MTARQTVFFKVLEGYFVLSLSIADFFQICTTLFFKFKKFF